MTLSALQYAYEAWYATSISCEPMLDDKIDLVIDAVRPYVTHSIWLGKMSKMKQRLEMNTTITAELRGKANQLYSWQSNDGIQALYERYKNDPMIRWKGDTKTVVGLPIGKIGSDE